MNNDTALTGGVIASTQGAVDNNKNSFTTGGALSITDVQNTASFKGTAIGGTIGVGSELGNSGAGVGNKSGNAASTSSAGISGIAGNTAVRTGDAETGLKPIFDADKVQREINAQVAITNAFTQQAGKTVGDYAQKQMQEANAKKEQAKNETDPDKRAALIREAQDIEGTWEEGKPGRVGLHALIGALTGNVAGALGAGASQAVIPYIADAIARLDAPLEVKQALIQVAGTAVGAAVGGASGGASALTITANNYLKHEERDKLASRYASCRYSTGSVSACQRQLIEEYAGKSVDNDKALLMACMNAQSTQCKTAMTESTDYSADRSMDSYGMNADRLRSGQVNFAQAYSLPNGQGVNYFTDRTSRNNFYQAVQDVVTAKGSTVMWPQMAADVTSDSKLGLHDLFAFPAMTNASKTINGAIFNDAFTQFSANLLFSAPITGMAADRFDRNMVRIEQIAAQPTWAQLQRQGVTPLLLQFGDSVFSDPRMSGALINQSDRIQFGNQIVDKYRSRIPLIPEQTTIPKTIP